MYCRFCGNQLPDNADKCTVCGSQVNSNKPKNSSSRGGGRYSAQKPKRSFGRIFRNLLLIVMAVVIVLVAFTIFTDTPDYISIVKNGHLGVYTDMTVGEIFEVYKHSYEQIWDGGVTDDGEELVEVKFSKAGEEPTIIQFIMLDDEVFKLSAFVDPDMPDLKPTDLIFFINSLYYSDKLPEAMESEIKKLDLFDLIKSTPSNAVMYGASHDYTGDRAHLFKLFGEEELEVSVLDMLEAYDAGAYELFYGSDYLEDMDTVKSPLSEVSQETEPFDLEAQESSEFPEYTVDELLRDYDQNSLRAKQKYQDAYITLTGEICNFGMDGTDFGMCAISYDGTSTGVLCRISSDEQREVLLHKNQWDQITIQCKVTDVGIGSSYVVDTIAFVGEDLETSHNVQLPVLQEPEVQVGSVLRSAGEIRIRSGPSTSYEDIGRLKGGTPVTIYEQQQEASGRWWGRMDDGWVCMDYIVFGEDNSIAPDYEMSTPRNKMSDYSGHWGDTVSMRCSMNITQGNDLLYISIKWGSSASSTTYWEFLGEFDASEGAVYYYNGVCTEYQTAEDGSQIQTTRYTNGEGVLVIQEGYLYWLDGTEGAGDSCIFERQ